MSWLARRMWGTVPFAASLGGVAGGGVLLFWDLELVETVGRSAQWSCVRGRDVEDRLAVGGALSTDAVELLVRRWAGRV